MRRRSLTLILSLAIVTAVLPQAHTASAATSISGYYLALGDSLAYGYQPTGDFSHGYADQLYSGIKSSTSHFTNLACPNESTTTFMKGGCSYWYIRKTFYLGSQLSAAKNFMNSHRGQVSLITIDIGANDVLPYINTSTCTLKTGWQTALSTFKSNFSSILSQLKTAMNVNGNGGNSLVAMNYYDPYMRDCASAPTKDVLNGLSDFNTAIREDARANGALLADVYTPFDGAGYPLDNTCSYTWMCDPAYHDIHPNTNGYWAIATAFQSPQTP